MKDLWKIQYEFNKQFLKKIKDIDINNISFVDKITLSKDYILHTIKELTEVLDTISWKMHKPVEYDNIRDNTIEELIDSQKFLWGLFQIWNVSEEEFSEQFVRKSKVVEQRFSQDFEIKNTIQDKKVVILDIDGVISDFPNCFIDFINKKTSNSFIDLFQVKNSLSISEIDSLKHDYRNSGEKRFLPVKNDIIDFINKINKKFNIVLLSSRPYHKYNRIYADTLEWLHSNDVKYNMILWDYKKDRSILKNFDINNIVFMIEDNLKFANKVSQIGVKVYLLDNIYNQGIVLKNVSRINSVKDIKI